MPARRDRAESLAAAFEQVATALREGDGAVYGYEVHSEPAAETGAVSYPDGRLEFRLERGEKAQE